MGSGKLKAERPKQKEKVAVQKPARSSVHT